MIYIYICIYIYIESHLLVTAGYLLSVYGLGCAVNLLGVRGVGLDFGLRCICFYVHIDMAK